jgi:hypothetical protein
MQNLKHLLRLNAVIDAAGIPVISCEETRIQYGDAATEQQRAEGDAILAAFDWSDEAQAAWQEDQYPDRKAIRQAAAGAIADNDAFLALASPTNAQVLAQVKRLTQQNTRIIKRLIQID